jgi:hypothetical protein
MTDHELVQIMAAKLGAFEKGSMPLHQIVGELKGLQDSLNTPKPDWIEQFDKERFALEEVNALRLDEESSGEDQYDDFVREKTSRLRELIEAYPESTL